MGLGPLELSLSLGWAGEALPNPRDTRPGSLPTLPNPERIWAALKQKKKKNGERVTPGRPQPDVAATNPAGDGVASGFSDLSTPKLGREG